MTDRTCRCGQGHLNPAGQRYCGTCGTLLVGPGPLVWSGPGEALRVVSYPPHLLRTILTALAVGTILFGINQLNVVLAGHATGVVWLKSGLTYCVPFVVSNIGILIATYRSRGSES
ncbi:MAG: nitrate/nitrite transporter NrtS [Acidimicrobiales bacterium]